MFSCLIGFCLGWIIHPRLNDSMGKGHKQAHLLGDKQLFRLSWAFLGFLGFWVFVLGLVFRSWALCFGMVFAVAMPWPSFCFRLGPLCYYRFGYSFKC